MNNIIMSKFVEIRVPRNQELFTFLKNSLNMNNSYLLGSYFESGTILSSLYILTHLSLQTTL